MGHTIDAPYNKSFESQVSYSTTNNVYDYMSRGKGGSNNDYQSMSWGMFSKQFAKNFMGQKYVENSTKKNYKKISVFNHTTFPNVFGSTDAAGAPNISLDEYFQGYTFDDLDKLVQVDKGVSANKGYGSELSVDIISK